jgi:hypothetical protein
MSFNFRRSSRRRRSRRQKKSKCATRRRTLRLESLERREMLHAGHESHEHGPIDVIPPATTEITDTAVVAALTPQSLLPDMIAWGSQSEGFIYDWTITGNDLRLTTAAANIGTGRMELRGGAVVGSSQQVMQRIYEPNGTFTDVLAGTFTYHPEHDHVHFDGFAEYRLRSVLSDGGVGPVVATGDKVSFCLLDVERYGTVGSGSPFYLTCGDVQGISPGWADVYDRGLPGQSIDISAVPNGNYWLEVVVDPDNHLIESNEDNNATRIQINLQRSGGGGGITPDVFEPNNTFADASILAPPEDHVYSNLNLHASNDFDFFRVTASASGTMAFRLAFTNSQGDVELEVFDSTQTRIGLSDSTTNNEVVSFTAIAGQYYYARVYGYNGVTNPNYTLTVDQPEGVGGGAGDQFEDNDNFAGAYTLPVADATYTGLTINTANDDDYYRIVPTTSGTVSVSVAFTHSQGDIDMRVFNASQTQIGISDATGNAESFSWNATAGQAYFIRVYGYQGATNPSYSMTIDVPGTAPPVIPPDSLEENDTFATARSLTASDQTYSSLTINAANDDDYYAIVPANSGTLVVSTAFTHSQGNVDLQVLNSSQVQLGLSNSMANAEQLSLAVTAGQTYYVRVFGASGATSPNYSLTIDVPSAPPVIPADSLEENDTFATARSLAASDQTYSSLTINAANDDDYYSIVPANSGTLVVSTAFTHSQGNVDLQILNSSQTQLGLSNSTTNSEQLSVAVTAGQTYYVRVFGASGATSPNYSLTVDVPAPAAPGDALENNDTFATARVLTPVDQVYSNLSIDAANDDDYYALTPIASGTVTVSLAFTHSQGDIDMRVFNGSQTEIGLADSTTNAEQFSFVATAGQTYYVRVYGYRGAVNPNYTMTIDVPTPPAPGTGSVTYLSLTDGGTLTSTDGSPSLNFTDADILKLTVQPNGQFGYALHFDGSDVGLTTANEDVDAFAFLADGSIVVSTVGSFSVPAAGGATITGGGEDLLRFVPTTLGATTAGTWTLYFDGSDVGLSGTAENIDAVAQLADGRLLISTTGAISVTGASGQDEDLVAFTPTTLGATTAGSWSLYFDGSDVGLSTNDNEDVNALYVREGGANPTLYLSTLGNFSVTGSSGANEDAFAFAPSSIGSTTAGTFGPDLAFDGSLYGLALLAIDGIHLVPPASPLAATASNLVSLPPTTLQSSQQPQQRNQRPQQQQQQRAQQDANLLLALQNATSIPTATGSTSGASSTATSTTSRLAANRQAWDQLANSLDEIFAGIRQR